jgi:hypothetical protein
MHSWHERLSIAEDIMDIFAPAGNINELVVSFVVSFRCKLDFQPQKNPFLIGETGGTGGEGGIRTLGRDLNPYNALAKRRYRPLSHLS